MVNNAGRVVSYVVSLINFRGSLEGKRVRGIEPPCAAWEAAVLPLNYTRGRILDFRLPTCDLQAANNHCHEITSPEPEKLFAVPLSLLLKPVAGGPPPNAPFLPKAHVITPMWRGVPPGGEGSLTYGLVRLLS